MRRKWDIQLALVLTAVLTVGAAVPAQAAEPDLQAMVDELTKVDAELKQIPTKLEENLAIKRRHEAELAPINAAWDQLDSVKANIDSQAPSVDSTCHRTVPKEELAAAHAQCQAVLNPFNARVDAYNAQRQVLLNREAPIKQAEADRISKAREIKQAYDSLTQRRTTLSNAIRAAMLASCPQSLSGNEDNIAHAASACFDGTRRTTATVNAGPTSSITPNRTPEQAIEDYRNSGAATPSTQSSRSKPKPPPPPK